MFTMLDSLTVILITTLSSVTALTVDHTKTDVYTHSKRILESDSDPRVFGLRTVFEGSWRSSNSKDKQFGDFDKATGWTRCQFSYAQHNASKYLYLEVLNGVVYHNTAIRG